MSERERVEKATSFLEEGLDILKSAVIKVGASGMMWGALGVVIGFFTFIFLKLFGAMDIDWKYWGFVSWLIVWPGLYTAAPAVGMGQAGVFRGLGSVLIDVGVKRGYVAYLVELLIDEMIALLRKNDTLNSAMDSSQAFVENLPIEAIEDALKDAVQRLTTGEEGIVVKAGLRAKLMRTVRDALFAKIERATLPELRSDDVSGISLKRVRDIILDSAEKKYTDAIEAQRDAATKRGYLIMLASFAIVPIIAIFV